MKNNRALSFYKSAYGSYALAAFNVFNAEQLHGVLAGIQRSKLPAIVQITPAARNYLHPDMLHMMVNAGRNIYPLADFIVHLDHGTQEHCMKAIASSAYDSVMIDASHEAYDENIRITKKVVKAAHAKGIAVEAELGVLSGVEDETSVDATKAFYTDPLQAADFVAQTGCDALAVAVGTSHGAYKFSSGQGLKTDILAAIQQKLPAFPLVLHGASMVDPNEVELIHLFGGKLDQNAKGVAIDELLQAVSLGVCKINIATDIRLLWTRIHRAFFSEKPEMFDPVIPGKKFMTELELLVAEKIKNLKI
jgi:fructose-bisphosphate aldolase class II